MEVPSEKNIFGTNELKRVLVVYFLVIFGLGFLGPLGLVFEISQTSEAFDLPSIGSAVFPAIQAFSIGLLVSWITGKWATSWFITNYKTQHLSQGFVLENQNSIFANFGFNVLMGAFIGASFFEGYICQVPITEDISGSVTALLSCKTVFNSAISLIVGIFIGFGSWLIYQVVSIERETNQKMVVQFYSTRQRSLIGIVGVAVTVFVLGLTFYEIFTLG